MIVVGQTSDAFQILRCGRERGKKETRTNERGSTALCNGDMQRGGDAALGGEKSSDTRWRSVIERFEAGQLTGMLDLEDADRRGC